MQVFLPVWQDEAQAPAVSTARLAPEPSTFAIRSDWGTLIRKVLHGALLVGGVKLLTAWTVAALRSVSLDTNMLWGFIPFTSLDATASQYRSVADWSTALACIAAVVWVGLHAVRPHKYSLAQVIGANVVLGVAALLVLADWARTVAGERLISTGWLVTLLVALGAAAVAVILTTDGPTKRAERHAQELGLPTTSLQLPPQM